MYVPIDGGLSTWSKWSICTKGCGKGGTQTRHRQCNQPIPKHGGRYCKGTKLETQSCNTDDCPGMFVKTIEELRNYVIVMVLLMFFGKNY